MIIVYCSVKKPNHGTVKPVLNRHPRDPRYCPLNRGVHLVQVHFIENKGKKNWSLPRLVSA